MICSSKDSGFRGKSHPLDHNKKTGQIRGILCHKCNTMIGLAGENPVVLRKAIEYLRFWERSWTHKKSTPGLKALLPLQLAEPLVVC
jgi:hypothetical protein